MAQQSHQTLAAYDCLEQKPLAPQFNRPILKRIHQQIETLEKHFRRFERHFGNHKIHEIPTLEISNWLAAQTDERTGRLWNAKTRINNLGSLVSLSVFSRDMLRAIPDVGKPEFQKVRRPKPDVRGEVEIYTT